MIDFLEYEVKGQEGEHRHLERETKLRSLTHKLKMILKTFSAETNLLPIIEDAIQANAQSNLGAIVDPADIRKLLYSS